jgi:glucan 1,3-beta-glucosidase
MENGDSFIYNNTFGMFILLVRTKFTAKFSPFSFPDSGGYWVSIPYNDTARPQRDIPALNEEWDYEKHLILGVNIGG